MRLRKKPWTDYEFSKSEYLISDSKANKGKWREVFQNNNPIHIEIGTGKGKFLTTMSVLNPEINYIAIERQTNVIVSALKKAREVQAGKNIVYFVGDAKEIPDFFNAKEIDRIYINFCDPWPNKRKWEKRRLTHANFLDIYEDILKPFGGLFFKTDNRDLFEFSLNEICNKGWQLKNISLDLHNSTIEDNVKTEYEQKFSEKGMPIYRLEAYLKN